MSTCNQLDLQTLGSQPVMPKYLPDRCSNQEGRNLQHGSKGGSELGFHLRPTQFLLWVDWSLEYKDFHSL